MQTELICRHIEYNRWATSRLLTACSDLSQEQLERDFGTSDKSVAGTLLHIFRAERLWLDRIRTGRGEFVRPPDGWSYIQANWPGLQHEWTEYVSSLTSDDFARVFEYRDLKGNPQADAVFDSILHMVNHGTHHRGQVSGFLRMMGVVPPPLDFIAFVRQRQP